MARIVTPWHFLWGNEVAKNSLIATSETPISIKSGVADVAVAGDKIEGISVETKTFASDNETTVKAKLEFARLTDETLVEFDVVGGTIDQSDIGTNFNLDASSDVDGTTGGTGTQLTLRKVVTPTLGQYVRAK